MVKQAFSEDITRFKELLLKEEKESNLRVSNKIDIEKAADEGRTIVLKNNPLAFILIYGIILAVFLSMLVTMSFTGYDIVTIIVLFSVWGVSVLITIPIVVTHTIILHPEGFFVRKRIFHTFSQKWINLTSKPETAINTASTGSKQHVLKIPGSWGIEKVEITFIRIKGLRKRKVKTEFLGKIALKYYERAQKL